MSSSRQRFSHIGHQGMWHWNPVDPDALLEAVASLSLGPDARILDIGCGKANFLLQLLKRTGASGLGIDADADVLQFAQENAQTLGLSERISWQASEFQLEALDGERFDLVVCLGSSHACGENLWPLLASLVKPHGHLLLGEGYWQNWPAQEYLDFLGCAEEDLLSHTLTSQLGQSVGLNCVSARETTAEEWAKYEDTYAANLFSFIEANLDDPDTAAFRERISGWRHAYLKWGYKTLGFGLYLLQKK